jgi:endonuclease/exonuclease/phosphatase family metal-dependent hydrolase
MERTAELASELPVIITGDFNSIIGTKAFDILTDKSSDFNLVDAYQASETHQIFNCTGDDCDDSTHSGGEGQIDHIFFSGSGITCSEWGVDKFSYGDDQRPPSDHFAIISKIKIPAEKAAQ